MIHFDRALLPVHEPHSGNGDTKEAEILHLRSATTAFHGPILERLRELGVTQMRSFWVANFIQVTATLDVAREVATWPEVLRLEPNEHQVRLHLPEQPNNTTENQHATNNSPRDGVVSLHKRGIQNVMWHHTIMNVPALWERGITGEGIVVGSADTGVQYDHPALLTQYRGYNGNHDYNWFDPVETSASNPCGSHSSAPCDDNGHGTHTTGSAVGDDGADNRIGVAYGAKWIACRNMDRGTGTPLWYIECLQFMLAPTKRNGDDPQPSLRPHVIINSYACPEDEGCSDLNILREAVDNVVNAGIFMAVAAGNTGASCSTIGMPPAVYESSYTVGASDSKNNLAHFSSRGPILLGGGGARIGPQITAPGVSIVSSFPGGGYHTLSGTSMATPQISGVVALLGQAYPSLQRDVESMGDLMAQTAHRVATSACSSDASEPMNNLYGYGIVDAESAYLFLEAPSSSPSASPSAQPSPSVDLSSTPSRTSTPSVAVSPSSVGELTIDLTSSSEEQLSSLPSRNISSGACAFTVNVMTCFFVLLFLTF